MHRVVVPQLFENMEEATIGSWLVREGQEVLENHPLCELITEKTTLELPSPASGMVRRLVVPAKSVVPSNAVIALIGLADEPLPEIALESSPVADSPDSQPSIQPLHQPASRPTTSGRLRATPAARRVARELGIDLEQVAVWNGGKVVSEEDVKRFAEAGS